MRPLAVELFCGSFGWSHGWSELGGSVVGFDIDHQPYHGPVPAGAELVLQDVLTLDGRQFKDASLILASPPCQEFSYMQMPWSRGKQIAAALRGQGEFPEGYTGSRTVAELTALFDACFRIQREASAAAGRHIPMVVENVRGAQPWVGKARWLFGSFALWGDVPALMPITLKAVKVGGIDFNDFKNGKGTSPAFNDVRHEAYATKNTGGSWFNIGSPGQKVTNQNPVHRIASDEGTKVPSEAGRRTDPGKGARKAASARIARIPEALSRHIAETYWP